MKNGIFYTEELIDINKVTYIRMVYRYFMNDKVLYSCAYILGFNELQFKSEIRTRMREDIKYKIKML